MGRPAARRGAAGPFLTGFDAVVLAAGTSRRMAPRNKLLATDAAGRSLIGRALAPVLACGPRRLVLVVGNQAAAVAAAAAAGDTATLVVCADHAAGQSRSLVAGLAALPADGGPVLVALGDMPLIEPALIRLLLERFAPGAIVAPAWAGRRGNPILWDRALLPEMMRVTGDRGARDLLARFSDRVVTVAAPSDAVLRDADTPAALAALPGGPWRTNG